MSNDYLIHSVKNVLRVVMGLVVLCSLGFSAATSAVAQEIVAIAAGGPAESNSGGGDYSFVADEDFSGGGDNRRSRPPSI